jgi:hypothetical protein
MARMPISTANFLRYVDTRRFDGISFYRAMHLAWGDQPDGLLQGGLRDPRRRLFPPIARANRRARPACTAVRRRDLHGAQRAGDSHGRISRSCCPI